jgi:alpha-beta hydrolase superfamily lysophospholipase
VSPQPLDQLPRSVRDHARNTTLGPTGVPALLAHPRDWDEPAPFCLWMHGRSVHKELDPGRYARWLRAGIGVVAIDLPGHGERDDAPRHGPEHTVEVIHEALTEIDSVLEALRGPGLAGSFDLENCAIGGMSMGGMITLRRLCDHHEFRCAAVEGTTGDLCGLYFPRDEDAHDPWPVRHDEEKVAPVDANQHIDTFAPLPLLVLHSEADEMVPWRVQERFIRRLREHFEREGASPDLVEVHTWPETGAPAEHVGFGRFSNDAKNLQTDFLVRHLLGES